MQFLISSSSQVVSGSVPEQKVCNICETLGLANVHIHRSKEQIFHVWICIHLFNSLPTAYFYLLFCRLLIFFKIIFFERFFRNSIGVSNSLDPDQARHAVGSYLGPNCLQRLSADDTTKS